MIFELRDVANSRAVDAVLTAKGRQQEELISGLLEDERYQREAFSSLLLRQDRRHLEITRRVERVQSELAALTAVEVARRDLRADAECAAVAEKRETLTGLLLGLMEQREERAEELKKRMREMEDARWARTGVHDRGIILLLLLFFYLLFLSFL